MKHIWLVGLLFLFIGTTAAAQADIFNPMRDAIKAGNAKELAKHFNQSVDLNLEGNTSIYSKTQAEIVIRDFFQKHPKSDFAIVHTGSSKGGLQFAIGRFVSGGQNYSVLMRVRQVGEVFLIHEISFVKE
ncbi:MAG: DUF4783 domain-containing protein [Cyclobacteriaceae bacterium]|nr:DUF4783 domain-containing protein [Cyclobacteriaceae bacterium]